MKTLRIPSLLARWTRLATGLVLAAPFLAAQVAPVPADAGMVIHLPSNTGIAGTNDVLFADFGPDGRLWTGARDFFWQQGGVAALDLESGLWETHSSLDTTLDQWNYAIDFAADGSAWIASKGVVNHFDGSHFTAYTPENSPLVVGPYEDIAVDIEGHVWAANAGSVSSGGGLFEFDGTEWVRHHEPWMLNFAGDPAPPIGVFARSNGQIWASFATQGNGLGLFEGQTWTQQIGQPVLLRFAEAPDGTLFGVNGFGTWRLDDTTGDWTQIGTQGSSTLAIDAATGWIYIGGGNHVVYRHDGNSWTPFTVMPDAIRDISIADDGDVWVAARYSQGVEAIYHFTQTELIRVYNGINTGVPDYGLRSTYHDRTGNAWFVSLEYGATRLEAGEDYRNFGPLNMGEEVYPFDLGGGQLLSESVGGVYEDSAGNTWFAGGGAARSHGDDLTQWDLWHWQNSSLPSLYFKEIGEDPQGRIYLGGDFAAYRFNGQDWDEVPVGSSPTFAAIRFVQGQDGELYAYRANRMYKLVGDAFELQVSVPFLQIIDADVGPDGHIWMATSDGLKRFDGSALTTYTPANSGLAQTHCTAVEIRADGLVAAVTEDTVFLPYDGGLSFFDGQEWTTFGYGESALPFYINRGLSFDAQGDLWMAALNFGAVEVLVGAGEGPGWVDLGGGTTGIAGQPHLTGTGSLANGSPLGLQLTQAPALAPMLLWISLDSTPLPALGGTLHSVPVDAEFLVAADAAGTFATGGTSPGVPAGTQVWFQFVCLDTSVPGTLTLSNAVTIAAP